MPLMHCDVIQCMSYIYHHPHFTRKRKSVDYKDVISGCYSSIAVSTYVLNASPSSQLISLL